MIYNQLRSTIKKASEKHAAEKFALYLDFYSKNGEISDIRQEYKNHNFRRAFDKLARFISENKHILFLKLMIVNKAGFVNRELNDYKKNVNNYCVIKSQSQLIIKLEQLKRLKKPDDIKIVTEALNKAGRSGYSMMIMDKPSDYKTAFMDLSHELNAWFMSGCAENNKRFKCLINDWRLYIPKNNLHRRLDKYLWTKKLT